LIERYRAQELRVARLGLASAGNGAQAVLLGFDSAEATGFSSPSGCVPSYRYPPSGPVLAWSLLPHAAQAPSEPLQLQPGQRWLLPSCVGQACTGSGEGVGIGADILEVLDATHGRYEHSGRTVSLEDGMITEQGSGTTRLELQVASREAGIARVLVVLTRVEGVSSVTRLAKAGFATQLEPGAADTPFAGKTVMGCCRNRALSSLEVQDEEGNAVFVYRKEDGARFEYSFYHPKLQRSGERWNIAPGPNLEGTFPTPPTAWTPIRRIGSDRLLVLTTYDSAFPSADILTLVDTRP
jgi:hypothetical protein